MQTMENLSSFIHSTEDIPNPTIPQSATCRYRLLQLTNQMRILLVSDPHTKKSAASLDVHVGSTSDPHRLQGLAHFLEHMLFAGNAKYPKENDLMHFISRHGGHMNGETGSDHTNYYFDVSSRHLVGALDRLAQMFLSPLFTTSAIKRCLKEIHSEFELHRHQDEIRIQYAEKETMNPDHPFCKFAIGNKYSLGHIYPSEIQKELKRFHRRYYSSNRMCMVVRGKESLDELVEIVVPIFAALENKAAPIPVWPDIRLEDRNSPVQVNIVSLTGGYELRVCWHLEDMSRCFRSQPASCLAICICHKGPGSLLALLKVYDWAYSITANIDEQAEHKFQFFRIRIGLTYSGLYNIDRIITLFFQYLNMLSKEGLEMCHNEMAQSMAVHSLGFDSHIKYLQILKDVATKLHRLSTMSSITPEEILYFPLGPYDPAAIQRVLQKLHPRAMRVTLLCQNLIWPTPESWFGTQYSVQQISEQALQQWEQAGTNHYFHLPSPNNVFVPTDFNLYVSRETALASPIILQSCHRSTVWYKTNPASPEPKLCFTVSFSLDRDDDNESVAFAGLLNILVQDDTQELQYIAQKAGIDLKCLHIGSGFVLSISGYYDGQDRLLKEIMKKIINASFSRDRLYHLKLQCYGSFLCRMNNIYGIYFGARPAECKKEKLIPIVENISPDQMWVFIQTFLADVKLKILLFGNVSKERAKYMSDIVENDFRVLTTVPRPATDSVKYHTVQNLPLQSVSHHWSSLHGMPPYTFPHPAMPPILFPHPATFPIQFPHPATSTIIFPFPVMHQGLFIHPISPNTPLPHLAKPQMQHPHPVCSSNPLIHPGLSTGPMPLPPINEIQPDPMIECQSQNGTAGLRLMSLKNQNEPHNSSYISELPSGGYKTFHVTYGSPSDNPRKSDILFLLLHQLIKEPCITVLRSYRQLGYSAQCVVEYIDGKASFVLPTAYKFGYDINGLRISIYPIIDTDLADVERYVDEFLGQFGIEMKEMCDAEFKDHVHSLALDIENSDSWEEQNYMYWSQCLGRRVFDPNVMLRNLMALTKRDVRAFFQECIAKKVLLNSNEIPVG